MATTANILTLLKFYASKQKSPMVDYDEFADYIRRYAGHHLEENPDLVKYMGASSQTLDTEISELTANHQVIVAPVGNKDFIHVVPSYVEQFANSYKLIDANIAVPFPNFNDLGKHTPHEIVTTKPLAELLYSMLEGTQDAEPVLYSSSVAKGIPALLVPSTVPATTIVNLALRKIQNIMHKDEVHDYFLKKLTISNPGKEISAKNFFKKFCSKADEALEFLSNTGETFYYWSQLCYFLRQDYIKVKDFTPEDINILQSVGILEVATSYYKTKATERQQRDAALKILELQLNQPPYYYNYSDIKDFKDSNGAPLLGQYSEEDLNAHLKHMTQDSSDGELPPLLIFRITENEGYFILKEKVMPLIMRLTSDARVLVRESLIKSWYKIMREWDTLPEMKDNAAFERCLSKEIQSCAPILHAILGASFLPVISLEDHTPGHINLYRNEALIPLSELLMLSRAEIYIDARIKLPFWYTIPGISWIISLLARPPKNKRNKARNGKSATAALMEEKRHKEEEKERELDVKDRGDASKNRKRQLRKAAGEAEKLLVPSSSSLDRELEGYLHEWNDRIGKQNFDDLTQDVNSLIRDYLRKVMRSLKTENFSMERISSLADSLVESPVMLKIHNHPALKRYVELYLVKLVKNLP